MRFIPVILVCLLFCTYSSAQVNPLVDSIPKKIKDSLLKNMSLTSGGMDFLAIKRNPYLSPASPEAASFLRRGEYGVSHNTGLPNISIPIYTIQTKDLTFPIELTYNAGGIKVDDQASWVGLGWNLSAGGVVNVSVLDLPDNENADIPSATTIRSNNDLSRLLIMLNDASAGYERYIDKMKDKYSYSFGGESGSFYFSANNQVDQVPYTNNKISKLKENVANPNQVTGFKIVLPNGNAYYFTNPEENTISTQSVTYEGSGTGTSPKRSIASWYLSKIVSFNKTDSITFTYENDLTPYDDYSLSESFTQGEKSGQKPEGGSFTSNTLLAYEESYSTHITTKRAHNTLILKEILFSDGKIVFTHLKDRTDSRKHRLTQTSIYNNQGLVRTVKFNNVNNTIWKRLRLESVAFLGTDNKEYDKQTFEYFEDYNLPAPYNGEIKPLGTVDPYFAQDLCGYFNGNANKGLSHILPNKIWNYNNIITQANRNFSFQHARTYSLKSIKYLTGGETEFIYDSESQFLIATAPRSPALRIKEIITSARSGDSIPVEHRVYKYENVSYEHKYAGDNGDYADVSYTYYHGGPVGGSGTYPWEYVKMNRTYHSDCLINGWADNRACKYLKVEEFQIGKNNTDSLKTVYEFDNQGALLKFTKSWLIFHTTLFPLFSDGMFPLNSTIYTEMNVRNYNVPGYVLDKKWAEGSLVTKTTYKSENGTYTPVEKVTNQYTFTRRNDNLQVGFYLKGIFIDNYLQDAYAKDVSINKYYFFDIPTSTGLKQLASTLTETYTANGIITKNETYQYAGPYSLLSSQLEDWGSGKMKLLQYKYPGDLSDQPVYQKMVIGNSIAPVVVSSTNYIDNSIIRRKEETKTDYVVRNVGGKELIVPGSLVYNISKTDSPPWNMTTSGYQTQILAHDIMGNPLHTIDHTGISKVYLWGYKHLRRIAEINNASYQEVKAVISESTLNTIAAKAEPLPADFALINTLRNALPTAQIETFKYKPLVGLTESQNMRGYTNYYDYDAFGRLVVVKDKDQKILKAHEYSEVITYHFDLILNTRTLYPIGDSAVFNAILARGSGNFSCSWYLKDKSGNIIKQQVNSTTKTFSAKLNQIGEMDLLCVVKDLVSNETVEMFRHFKVVTPIEFKNIFYDINNPVPSNTKPFSTVEVNCDEATTVTFQFTFDDKGWFDCPKVIRYKINGNEYTMTNTIKSEEKSYSLPKGKNILEVFIVNGFHGATTYSGIEIFGVSGENLIGTTKMINYPF